MYYNNTRSLFFYYLKEIAIKKRKPQKKPSLNPRQITFCKEYLIDFNGTQAAIRAGFSEHTANEQASRLLAKANIRAEVDRLRKQREDRLEASADFVVRELMRLAKVNIRQAFNKDGSLKNIHEMPEDLTRCISSIEVKELWEPKEDESGKEQTGWIKSIKVWDKKGALELLGEHFGIYKRQAEREVAGEDKKKKLDLIQVIKLVAKDGQTTTISNRISEGSSESPVVALPRPGGLVIVGRSSRDTRGNSESHSAE